MKVIGALYLINHNNKLYITNEVKYYDRGYYIFEDEGDIFSIHADNLIILSISGKVELIRNLRDSVESNKIISDSFSQFHIFEDKFKSVLFEPSGIIKVGNSICVVSCPRNIFKEEYVTIIKYGSAYRVVPCDVKGKIKIKREKRQSNPYSNSCNIVYDCIYWNPNVSTGDLIDLLGLPANRVTSRVSDLLNGGRIQGSGKIFNEDTNRLQTKWVVMDEI